MSEQITCFFSGTCQKWYCLDLWWAIEKPIDSHFFSYWEKKNISLISYPHLSNKMRAHLDIRLTWLWALLPQNLNKSVEVRPYFIDEQLIVKCWSCTSTKFQSSFWEPKNCNSRLIIAVLIVQCTFAKVVSGKPPEF